MRFLIINFITLLILFNFLASQNWRESPKEKQQKFDIDLEQLEKSSQQVIPQPQYLEQILAKEIDSTEYILGPGDQLLIKIWGPLENQFLAEITPEGYIVIPTVSDIKISGLTLAAGSDKIRHKLQNYYKNSSFTIRLIKMRKFRIYIVGEIKTPGTYYIRAVDRMSDVIELAGGFTQWADETQIEVREEKGNNYHYNINNFFLSGNLDDNPTLDGGNIIYVPPIDLEKNYVVVEGNVGSEGIYQIQQGEDIYTFMTRIRAINRRSNLNNIIIVRREEKKIYDLINDISIVRETELKSGDRIIIPSNRDRVYVKGEVFQPGPFPYMANFVARDYAGMAGLLETGKSVDNIYVIHGSNGKVEKGGSVIVDKGDIVVVPQRPRENTKDILAIITPIISIGLSTFAIIQASK
ncbi:MAG: polysaccharide biosynthesis/export family protein [Calditrichaeota bacterium]|nr:polysaccharide biosynthesis/export family protein [Calditrichota bacterium]